MTSSSGAPVEERIKAAIVRALGPGAAEGGAYAMGATPGWDSMGHMTVVMEIESEFGVRFPAYHLPQLVSLDAIARALQEAQPAREHDP